MVTISQFSPIAAPQQLPTGRGCARTRPYSGSKTLNPDYAKLTTTARRREVRGKERIQLLFDAAQRKKLKSYVGRKYFIYAIEKHNGNDVEAVYVGKTSDVVKRMYKHGSIATRKPESSAIATDLNVNCGNNAFVVRVCLICPVALANDNESRIIDLYRDILGHDNVYNVDEGGGGGVAQWVVEELCDKPFVPSTYATPTKKSGTFHRGPDDKILAELSPSKGQNVVAMLKRTGSDGVETRHVFMAGSLEAEMSRYLSDANKHSPEKPALKALKQSPHKFTLHKLKENIEPAHLAQHERNAIVEKRQKGDVYNRDNGGTGPRPDPYRRRVNVTLFPDA